MKSYVYFIAALFIMTSCAQQEMLEPTVNLDQPTEVSGANENGQSGVALGQDQSTAAELSIVSSPYVGKIYRAALFFESRKGVYKIQEIDMQGVANYWTYDSQGRWEPNVIDISADLYSAVPSAQTSSLNGSYVIAVYEVSSDPAKELGEVNENPYEEFSSATLDVAREVAQGSNEESVRFGQWTFTKEVSIPAPEMYTMVEAEYGHVASRSFIFMSYQ